MNAVAAPTGRPLVVALAGNPNAGKTTLFNALTGLRQKVANYPGVTVEKKSGRCHAPGGDVDVIDLPGAYSLVANSPDEAVTAAILTGQRADTPAPDAIVAVVDASNLSRNLFLVSQLIELGRPLVIALTMVDVAARRGQPIDAPALARALGVPVVPVTGHRRHGVDRLLVALHQAVVAPTPVWPLPEALWEEAHELSRSIADLPEPLRVAAARRLLAGESGGDLAAVERQPAVVAALARSRARLHNLGIDAMQADIEARYRWIDGVVGGVRGERPVGRTLSERVDAVLLHPVAGLGVFALIMFALFMTLFAYVGPLVDGIDAIVGWLQAEVGDAMSAGPLRDLVVDGVIAGVGSVIVFVPQIALLYLFLAALEDSGYLARAAFLMDRVLAGVGLHGKSFIPLLSSFACAIPGIMAARTIERARDRLATILVAPFMSCSARLPVYLLVIGAFLAGQSAWIQALAMLGCYVLGILAAVGTALAFKLMGAKRERAQAFVLELPTYKAPQPSLVARQMWTNTAQFLTKAGTTIFCLSVLLWAMAYYPRAPQERVDAAMARAEAEVRASPPADVDAAVERAREHAAGHAQLEHSVAGRIGHAIEPVIAPLGFEWKIGVGLIGAFAAREVFNATLGIIYAVGDPGAGDDDDEIAANEDRLVTALRADRRDDGSPVWTPLVAVSLLAWFVLAMQCISTTAVVRRETGGWTVPLIQLAYMNALAWAVCFAIYQVGSRIWGG